MSTTTTTNHDRTTSHHRDPDGHHPHTLKGAIDHLTNDAYFGQEIDFVVGLTATALTANQVLKMRKSKHHKASHLAKAGLGAIAATTAFTMMAREHEAEKKHRAEVAEEREDLRRARLPLVQRRRPRSVGYVESLADSDSEEERFERGRRHGHEAIEYRRESIHREEFPATYEDWRREHESRSRSRSRSRSSRPRSRSPSVSRSHAPSARRAVSRSPVRKEQRSQSYPRLTRFFEAVRDSLEEQNRERR